jgi:hypothetical protein
VISLVDKRPSAATAQPPLGGISPVSKYELISGSPVRGPHSNLYTTSTQESARMVSSGSCKSLTTPSRSPRTR